MADYIAKTRWFTSAAQHGIYSCLLDVYYLEGEALPATRPDELRAMCTATPGEWEKYSQEILDRLFVRRGDFYHNKRADEEIEKYTKKHTRRSKSAKNAAETRWARERTAEAAALKPDQYQDARAAIELYNATAEAMGLSRCQKPDPARLRKIKARLGESGGLDGWKAALEKIGASDFLCGKVGGRGWKANIDFMCQASSFAKLMEGAYDNNTSAKSNHGVRSRQSIMEGVLRGVGAGEMDLGGAVAGGGESGGLETDGGADRGRRRAHNG